MSVAISTSSCTWTSSPQSVGGREQERWASAGRVPDHIRSDNGKLRDELLEREAIDTLLEANGTICALAAAKCLGLPAPGASRRGWSIGGQNPDLRTGVIHGGRSHLQEL